MIIKCLISCVIALLIFGGKTGSAFAQNNGGLGAYAAFHPKWPCDTMMRAFSGVSTLRLAVLWNSFGTDFKCLDKWASDPRPKFLETHLINEVCQRNNRCGSYELLKSLSASTYRKRLTAKDSALLARIRSNVQPVADWYSRNPNVACALSAGLESNLDSKSYLNLVAALKPIFPERCKWVWSPVGEKNPISGLIHEGHGDTPSVRAPCIVNMDGVDADLPARKAIVANNIPYNDLPRFLTSFASCDASFLWIAEFNGVGRGGFIDPRKRSNWPTGAIADQLNKQLKFHVEPAAAWSTEDEKAKFGCKSFLKVPDGAKKDFLWKQSDPPVLDRGAVTFLPRKFNKTKLKKEQVFVMKAGKVIATSYEHRFYTEDGSGRHFFRFHKLAKDFPYNVVVHYGNVCAVLPNPKTRVD